jgi:tRNA threonylcarbamoyladenosine biosynthesis protein TsaE
MSEPREAGWIRQVPTEAASAALAARFAATAEPPCVIWLQGDLGAGKTLFARAFIHALGYEGYVKSPSYGLLETYRAGGITVLHLDLYRIEDPEELEYLALRDLFDANTVLLVEWPDRGGDLLPPADLVLQFFEESDTRRIRCMPRTGRGRTLAERTA